MNVLILVDLQEGPFRVRNKHDADEVIRRVNKLADFVRATGGRVIHVQHDGEEEEDLLPGTSGWKVLSALCRDDSDIAIRKTRNDAFADTDLDSTLASLHATNILIAGWATDFCVDSTVRSAVSRGLNVYMPSDGHTVADRPHLRAVQVVEHHNWVWANLISNGGSITVAATEVLLANPKLNNALKNDAQKRAF